MPAATPSKLGRYEIAEELGRGAMGVVYLAKDPLIGRLVAIKTFRSAYSVKDEELPHFRARFIREAQSAGILSHPNIVTIHDVVEAGEDGMPFIAMEFVRGTNLKLLLQGSEPITHEFAVDVAAHVAGALRYAHSKGVIHRDVKPANILITSENGVKITDFGIARLSTSNLTVEGQLLGTPNYMAPEQVMGEESDHRADIFSLGVVLYEMLTRQKPFQGESLTVVAHKIAYEPFAPPDKLSPGLPPALIAVIHRALEKKPDRRYQNAGDMEQELRQAMPRAGEESASTQDLAPLVRTEVLPPKEKTLQRLAKKLRPAATASAAGPRRQARLVVAALSALALSLVCGLGAFVAFVPASPPEPATRAQDAAKLVYLPLLQEGRRLLRQGDPVGAARAFGEAERLAPGVDSVRLLREKTEGAAQEAAAATSREKEITDRLRQALSALAAGRYEEARSTSKAVLALRPEQAEAQNILAEAERALQRRREGEAPPATAETTPHSAATEKKPLPAAPPAAPAAAAAVAVHFTSEAPEGLLMIYAGGEQVLRQEFRFVKKSGLFRSQAVPGALEANLTLPAGTADLRVYVTLPGKPSKTIALPVRFTGGNHSLTIQVSKTGETAAGLN